MSLNPCPFSDPVCLIIINWHINTDTEFTKSSRQFRRKEWKWNHKMGWNIFVYGTLKKGEPNHWLIKKLRNHARFLSVAQTKGISWLPNQNCVFLQFYAIVKYTIQFFTCLSFIFNKYPNCNFQIQRNSHWLLTPKTIIFPSYSINQDTANQF